MIGIYLTYNNWLYATPLSYYLTPPMKGLYKYKYQRRAHTYKNEESWSGGECLFLFYFPTTWSGNHFRLCKSPIKMGIFAKIMNSPLNAGEFWFSMKYVQPLCAGLRYDLFVFKIRPTTYCHHQMVGWW